MELSRKGFGAYDVRGIYPDEVNEELAYRVGKAFVQLLGAKRVAVGHDIRLSGPSITEALTRGLTESGCDVVDIGQCGTEMIYFATFHLGLDGGIMVTASHNPKNYNGMKLVREKAIPISSDTGLKDIENLAIEGNFKPYDGPKGKIEKHDVTDEYVEHLLTYIDAKALKPMTVVVNAGNGAAGPIIDKLEKKLPVKLVKVYNEPDGNFPNGVPNPILPENRDVTAKAVRENKAAMGFAWDGDFDRCFLFDEQGGFIEGYYMVGFLAQSFLKKNPGGKVIYDPRLTWNTIEIAETFQFIFHSMGMNEVHNHFHPPSVCIVNERFEFVGRTEPAGSSKEIGDMVTERAVIGVLLYRHDLDAVVAEFGYTRQDVTAEFLVTAHFLLLRTHADVTFVDKERLI